MVYAVCKEHALTLSEYGSEHPADQAFLLHGYAEHQEREDSNAPNV